MRWKPHPGPQAAFCSSPAYELLFGGAMGGGKSVALIACALREIRHPSFRGLLLRRYEESLTDSGGLVERAWQVYKALGARPVKGGMTWIWPHGARIDLGGLANLTVLARRRPEIQYLGVDELSEFDQPIYWTTMLTRLRSAHGIPVYARATANPGGAGAEWIREHWGPFMYPPGHPDWDGPTAREGQLMWYRFVNDGKGGERVERCRRGDPGALSRSFVASTVASNMSIDPAGYAARLAGLDPLTRKQMLEGDFLAVPLPGIMFKRAWFTEALGTMLPSYAHRRADNPVRIRYWDRAATPDPKNPDEQAATCSLLLSMDWDRTLYVEHGTQDFLRPRGVKEQVLALAKEDAEEFGVGGVVSVLEQDPGQAGVGEIHDFAALLQGYAWAARRATGSKVERARPVSSSCEPLPSGAGGSVVVVRAAWNRPFFDDLEGFPVAKRKDFVDCLSGGYLECLERLSKLTRPAPPTRENREARPTRETAAHPGGY